MAEKHIIGYHKEDNPNCKCDNGVTYFNCGKKCECCALHPAGTGVAGKTTMTGGQYIGKGASQEIKANLLNSPTPNQYSILGGVAAPKSSAYTIQGMANPLAERPSKVLDTSRPSLRDNSATSRFNDFNPYNSSPKKSSEIIRNNMMVRSTIGQKVIELNVNTFQDTGSPILEKKYRG